MVMYGRDARTGPRSLKHLFSGNYKNAEANRLSGVYELLLRRASEAGSPGRSLVQCPSLTPILRYILKFGLLGMEVLTPSSL